MLFKYRSKILERHNGFTLVETLVAITVLIVGVLGPLNVAVRGITDGFYVKNQVTATFLAQEGLDLVRNKILKNQADMDPLFDWLTDLNDCKGSTCAVFANPELSSNFTSCEISSGGCRIRYSNGSGFYENYSESATNQTGLIFARETMIILNSIANSELEGREAKIIVKVSWQDKNTPRFTQLVDYVYDI